MKTVPPTVDATAWLDEQYRKDPGLRGRVEAAMTEMEVIEALVAMREASGMSQRALAEKIGMKQPALAALERGGTKNIGILTVARIAAGLGARMHITFEAGGATAKKPAKRKVARSA